MENDISKKDNQSLIITFNIILIVIMIFTVMMAVAQIFSFIINGVDEIKAFVEGLDNPNVGGWLIFTLPIIIPSYIIRMVFIGFLMAVLITFALLPLGYKIAKYKKVGGIDFFIAILFYCINFGVNRYAYSVQDFLYYVVEALKFGLVLEMIFLTILLIIKKKHKKEELGMISDDKKE